MSTILTVLVELIEACRSKPEPTVAHKRLAAHMHQAQRGPVWPWSR